jgi:hypothetical protein
LISFLLKNKNPLVLHLLDLVDLAYLFLYLGFGPAVVFWFLCGIHLAFIIS